MRTKVLAFLFALLIASTAHAQYSKSAIGSQVNSQFPDNSAGAITPSILRTFFNNIISSYQQYSGVNAQVGTTYTVQASDYGQLITISNANAVAVSLPAPATTGFNPFNTFVSNLGSGLVTITPTVPTTIGGVSTLTIVQNQSAWIVSDGTNYQTFKGYGSGVVNSGTAGQIAYYNLTGTGVSGTFSPALGTATISTLNGLTINSSTGTLSIANGKTISALNSLTLNGVDTKILSLQNTLTLAGTDNTTWTGPTTNANLAALNIQDQTLSGGVNVTSLSQSTGGITMDCGARPLQYISNTGAFTISAPNNDGSCILKITNGAGAAVPTFGGFSVGSNIGDTISTANTFKYMVFIYRINGDATYSVKALQ